MCRNSGKKRCGSRVPGLEACFYPFRRPRHAALPWMYGRDWQTPCLAWSLQLWSGSFWTPSCKKNSNKMFDEIWNCEFSRIQNYRENVTSSGLWQLVVMDCTYTALLACAEGEGTCFQLKNSYTCRRWRETKFDRFGLTFPPDKKLAYKRWGQPQSKAEPLLHRSSPHDVPRWFK